MLPRDDFVRLEGGAAKLSTIDVPRAGRKPYLLVKRAMDVLGALALFFGVLPLLVLLACLIYRDGGQPFYGQPRLGRGGKVFILWKLRTMVPDADKALARHLAEDPAARLEWDRTQKLRKDPRVTSIGYMLRKYSLDELPQLWNVLMGDMSLVGPRPMFPEQRSMYPGIPYCDLRPGLTGLWQVSDRNACAFADRAGFDRRYADTLSLRADLRILMLTVAVVFRGTGC